MADIKPGFYWVRYRNTDWTVARVTPSMVVGSDKLWIDFFDDSDGCELEFATDYEIGPRIEPPGGAPPMSTAHVAAVANAIAWIGWAEGHTQHVPRAKAPPDARLLADVAGFLAEPPGKRPGPPAMPRGYEMRVDPADGSVRAVDLYGAPAEKSLRFPNVDSVAGFGRALVTWAEAQKSGGR